ncbi:tail fiber domain-containing protein [Caballeronia sp. INSB1]|uniref:tail fiber domain-containing protein n=1 Tax=Caballeronia sp. INSB1 TaxID=2921751 RepID=UPI0020326D7F|nr:tail fiber domain-containing protein [Caballeronia sp. INSB1]
MPDIQSSVKLLSDPNVQMRALNASRTAIIEQLKKDGVELTPELIASLYKDASSRKDNGTDMAVGVILGGLVFSDKRLKDNIQFLDKSSDGLDVYSFSYRGSPYRWSGVLAQELLTTRPSAVHQDKTGFLMVNYDLIDVDFKQFV